MNRLVFMLMFFILIMNIRYGKGVFKEINFWLSDVFINIKWVFDYKLKVK